MPDNPPPIAYHNPPPKGVLPKRAGMWLMISLTVGIFSIVAFTGYSKEPARVVATSPSVVAVQNPDRVKEVRDRLREMEKRRIDPVEQLPPAVTKTTTAVSPKPIDPLIEERRKKDYESLFSPVVVVSRRSGAQRLSGADAGPSSLADITESVLRATRGESSAVTSLAATLPQATTSAQPTVRSPRAENGLHTLLEGSVIDGVLQNQLDGSTASPVVVLVSEPRYSNRGDVIVIPAGSRVIGETTPVQNFGETRLAVSFHRLIFPDDRSLDLDKFVGLTQKGETGLDGKVNNHLMSSLIVGGLTGIIMGAGQAVGNIGLGGSGNNRTTIIAGSASNSTSQATSQMMSRYASRLPSLTIPQGKRIKVYLSQDISLPAYGGVR